MNVEIFSHNITKTCEVRIVQRHPLRFYVTVKGSFENSAERDLAKCDTEEKARIFYDGFVAGWKTKTPMTI